MDRRQVDDVEAHPGDGREPLRRADQPALAAREQLVPGREGGTLAVDPHRCALGGGDEVAERVGDEQLGDGRVLGQREPLVHVERLVAEPGGGVGDRAPPLRGHAGRRTVEQQGALLELERDVDAGLDLQLDAVPPGRDRVGPALDLQRVRAGRADRDVTDEQVDAGRDQLEVGLGGVAVRAPEDRGGAHEVVALPEDGGPDLHQLTGGGARRVGTAVDHGVHVSDCDATDHRRGTTHGPRHHTVGRTGDVPRSPGCYVQMSQPGSLGSDG